MLTEQDVLWSRLKEKDKQLLADTLKEDFKNRLIEFENEMTQRLIEWLEWHKKYYKLEDFAEAFNAFTNEHVEFRGLIDWNVIDKHLGDAENKLCILDPYVYRSSVGMGKNNSAAHSKLQRLLNSIHNQKPKSNYQNLHKKSKRKFKKSP